MIVTNRILGAQPVEMAPQLPPVDVHFDVVQISPVRVLVYTYPNQGGLREVALVWRPEPQGDWRCAPCNLADCLHLRAFHRAPER